MIPLLLENVFIWSQRMKAMVVAFSLGLWLVKGQCLPLDRQSGENEESTRGSPGPGSSEHCARKLGSTGDDKCNCLCKHVASLDTEKKGMAIRHAYSVQSLRTCMQSITVWKY